MLSLFWVLLPELTCCLGLSTSYASHGLSYRHLQSLTCDKTLRFLAFSIWNTVEIPVGEKNNYSLLEKIAPSEELLAYKQFIA